jgi:carbon storage regulator CsrA
MPWHALCLKKEDCPLDGHGSVHASRRIDMPVLTRKLGERVVIGNGLTVTVVEVKGNRVRLAFDAPEEVRILRGELACWQDGPLEPDLEGIPD